MPTIYLSPDFATGHQNLSSAARIFEVGTAGSNLGAVSVNGGTLLQPLLPAAATGSTPYAAGRIIIMRGTAPTVISTVTSFSSYTSTVLCAFEGSDFTTPTGASYYASPTVLTSNYKAAVASGTATWFILASTAWGTSVATSYLNTATLWHQIVGDVGPVGSGADLEISNVNVTSGQLLRISNLRFSIPTTFTF